MIENKLSKKLTVLTNGSIENLLKNKFDGVKRVYLIRNRDSTLDILLMIINALKESLPDGNKFIFQAKYSMGYRNKRIDIAIWDKKRLFLCKLIRSKLKFDKEAIYLDQIISHLKYNLSFDIVYGCLICEEKIDRSFIKHIKKILVNSFVFLQAEDILKTHRLYTLSEISLI